MSKIQELDDMLRTGYQIESIVNDLGKTGQFNEFSEASKRTIRELENMELYELGEMYKTVQCQACLKYASEGLLYCLCGVCLIPSPEQTRKIKN